MKPPGLLVNGIEQCSFRRPAIGQDAGSATCGLVVELLGPFDAGSGLVTKEVCEHCCRSFPPTSSHPNPVVASLLYSRSLALASRAASAAEADRLRSIAGKARQALDLVHDRPPVPPPTREPESRTLAEIVPRPTSRHGRKVREWAVGVTTSPRIQPTLESMLTSLIRAGWERPHLFIDAPVRIPEPFAHLPCTFREEKLGAWPSYYLALMELLLRHPRADAYMVIQDDALLYDRKPLRPYLETVLWPGKLPGLVSIYCCELDTASKPGWHPCPGVSSSGPVAIVFPPDLAKAFVTDREVLEHRWAPDEAEATAIGDLIALWADAYGIPLWHPTPSLVQHIGETSTLWPMARATGPRRAGRFAGGNF
jgi:hypothetical protein